jgi:transcription termination factor NusB
MARRSRAREVALQLLFQQDVNAKTVPRAAVEQFAKDRLRDAELVTFALSLYDGVIAHRTAIDELIVKTRAHRPGDRLELTLERDGRERNVSLVLGSSDGA